MQILHFHKKIIIGLLALAIFGGGYLTGRSFETVPTLGSANREMPMFYVKKAAKQVCITFDISWGEQTLPPVLRILTEYQVKATFFLSGPWAAKHPDLVRSIFQQGHEIASHGDKHINLSQYPKDEVQQNISKAQQDLLSIVPKVAPYFRPPNGDYDDMVIITARELGFETVIWSIDSLDWKNPGPEFMVRRVTEKVFPGAIILCHASDSSKQIHLALPGIIQGIRNKGFQFITLSELQSGGEVGRNDPR